MGLFSLFFLDFTKVKLFSEIYKYLNNNFDFKIQISIFKLLNLRFKTAFSSLNLQIYILHIHIYLQRFPTANFAK